MKNFLLQRRHSLIGIGRYEIISNKYLTILSLENDLTVSFSNSGLEYCVNGRDWTTLDANVSTVSIASGEIISFRGNLTPTSSTGIGTFTISKRCRLLGNCNSLLFGDSAGDNSLSGKSYAFYKLFYNCTNIVSVSGNFLPSTTLGTYYYSNMFCGCTSLNNVPSLPATTLTNYCYAYMFSGCTALTAAPTLPATTLGTYCYNNMFKGCTALTAAPALPATTLASNCYSNMFLDCTSLTAAPALPATTLATYCYYYMFSGCTSLTAAPALPATTLSNYCYYYMFKGCTSLTTTPELPATTLATYCYAYMFSGCTSLKRSKQLPATTLSNYCYYNMFKGCTSLVVTPNLPATTLATYCYMYMFSGCTSLNTLVTNLPATTLKSYCYAYMFQGCTSLKIAPVISATTLATYCCYYMFQGCTSLTSSPELLATTLVTNCYSYMFDSCSKLNYIKAMFTTTPSTSYTNNWVNGVSSSGTFYKNPSATWNITSTYGIPSGWSVVTSGGTIGGGVGFGKNYLIDLNNQWRISELPKPEISGSINTLEGVYESNSNYNKNNEAAIMYIDFKASENFGFYIRSNGESNYDYVMVSQLDKEITNTTSYTNTTLVKAHTRGNPKSGNTLSDYTSVTFTGLDDNIHTVAILYRKDNSQHSGDDRGYVVINSLQ